MENNQLPPSLFLKEISLRVQEGNFIVENLLDEKKSKDYVSFMQEILFDMTQLEIVLKRMEDQAKTQGNPASNQEIPHETI